MWAHISSASTQPSASSPLSARHDNHLPQYINIHDNHLPPNNIHMSRAMHLKLPSNIATGMHFSTLAAKAAIRNYMLPSAVLKMPHIRSCIVCRDRSLWKCTCCRSASQCTCATAVKVHCMVQVRKKDERGCYLRERFAPEAVCAGQPRRHAHLADWDPSTASHL